MTGSGIARLAGAALFAFTASAGAQTTVQATTARAVRVEMAAVIAGINAHDPARATAFDAPGIVTMEGGRAPSVGAAADRAGLAMAFRYAPGWRLRLIDERVDVARSGDLAVYRCAADQMSTGPGGALMHERVNFIAGFEAAGAGRWLMTWSVVAPQENPHP